jgi:hypothetical protein
LAQFAKGGNHERLGNRVCEHGKRHVDSIATRPCKKRKDGAPAASMAQSNGTQRWATLYNPVGVVKRHVECPRFCSYFLESF